MSKFVIEKKCFGRIGLMGNPSDGFNGKTLSFLTSNFFATVQVSSIESTDVILVPHPEHDSTAFCSLADLQHHSSTKGYYGGLRLLQATCNTFASICDKVGLLERVAQRGFRMSYDSNIPRMVGLSGSSAIIVAAFRALLEYHNISLEDLKIAKHEFPEVILNIEKHELGISAGLQDRVIQTYGGLVHMDFTHTLAPNSYTSFDVALLPPLYLAYCTSAGGESGKVHSTVRERWLQKDPALVQGMQQLGGYADEAVECLRSANHARLAELMKLNFAMRRQLYGDAVVGARNLAVVEMASSLGLSSKFTGSGGAILCMRSDGKGWLNSDDESSAVAVLKSLGYQLVRVMTSDVPS